MDVKTVVKTILLAAVIFIPIWLLMGIFFVAFVLVAFYGEGMDYVPNWLRNLNTILSAAIAIGVSYFLFKK